MKINASAFSFALLATAKATAAFVTHPHAAGVVGRPSTTQRSALGPEINPPIVMDSPDDPDPTIPAYVRGMAIESQAVEALQPLGIKLTGAKKLHNEGLTGKGVKVAVIDSGVEVRHEGFNGKVVQQTWFRDGSSLMEDDHGTHVAGTIHMMAPEAEIYDYRVFGAKGMGVTNAIVASIDEAIEDGCDIINLSLGGPSRSFAMWRAIRKAHREGVLIVAAAGNGGDDNPLTTENMWPANFAQSMSIAAVSKEDDLPVAYFSNSNGQVDYAGIGVDVVSFRPDGEYHKMSGTSMASPHVCGFITALMTKGGAYSDIIKDDRTCRALLNEKFVIDIGTKGSDVMTGLGFLTYLSKEEFEEGFLDLPDLP